jgi:hypothetical protein
MGGDLASDFPYHDDVSRQPFTLMFPCQHELLTEIESKEDQPLDNESTLAALASAREHYAQLVWTACERRGRPAGGTSPFGDPDRNRLHANSSMRCAHVTAGRTMRK